MKKISLLLIGLIILAIPVLALNGMMSMNHVGDKTSYNVGVEIKKGWNLLIGFSPEYITLNKIRDNGGDVQEENIKAVYAFNPKNQQYIQWYPNPEIEKLRQLQNDNSDDFELLSTALWVYSDKTGYLKFENSDYILDLNKRNLYTGWNFVGITPEFLNEFSGKKFSEVKGNCNVQGAYFYNNKVYSGHETPSWERVYDDTTFLQDTQANGFIVKVNGACKLGTPSANIAPLPTLPA